MNPLDRAIRQRKRVIGRAAAVGVALIVGSAGIIVPPLKHHREATASLRSELESALDPLRRGAEAVEFRAQGLERLERAERELLRMAPTEPLPNTTRARLKDRLESMDIRPLEIEVLPRGPVELPDADAAEAPLFDGTPVVIRAKVTYEQIAPLVRSFSLDARPAFVTSLKVERDVHELSVLTLTMRVVYLHLMVAGGDEAEDE